MKPEARGETRIYDNTNLAESYAGTVTPLTFSFARDLYEGVYQHFAQFMGISSRKRREHADIFPRMVVSIGYHMYYDLRNWYVMISLLPGYAYNKGFFEKMLGVRSENSKVAMGDTGSDSQHRFYEVTRLITQMFVILGIFISMPFLIRRFSARFGRAYRSFVAMNLAAMTFDELCEHYKHVRDDLVRLWRIPIANDFAVMVSVGAAHRLYKAWTGREDFVSKLRLVSNAHLATLDPSRALFSIVDELRHDEGIFERLTSKTAKDAYETLLRKHHGTRAPRLIEEYIDRYGSRVPNELKLETPTLREAPEQIISLLLSVDASHHTLTSRLSLRDKEDAFADRDIGFFRRSVLHLLILWARRSIRYREETRLARTQIFGHARQVFLRIGDTLVEKGILSHRTDVLYLTAEDVCNIAQLVSPQKIVEKRKADVEMWRHVVMPSRLESTESIPDLEKTILAGGFKVPSRGTEEMRGVVASRGNDPMISGEALVMTEFEADADFRDKILVTRHTDPGWVVAFSLVRAIVVERGGILSHASIVAREMNIPCIIGLQEATSRIPNTAPITLDLETGCVALNASRT